MVIFESTLSSRAFGHDIGVNILGGVGRVMPLPLGLLALAMREGYSCFPHQMDIWVSATLVCWAVLFVIIANRLLPMIHHEEETDEEE